MDNYSLVRETSEMAQGAARSREGGFIVSDPKRLEALNKRKAMLDERGLPIDCTDILSSHRFFGSYREEPFCPEKKPINGFWDAMGAIFSVLGSDVAHCLHCGETIIKRSKRERGKKIAFDCSCPICKGAISVEMTEEKVRITEL